MYLVVEGVSCHHLHVSLGKLILLFISPNETQNGENVQFDISQATISFNVIIYL